jgi:hypothetical protein
MRDDETILKLYSEDRYDKLTAEERVRLCALREKDEKAR